MHVFKKNKKDAFRADNTADSWPYYIFYPSKLTSASTDKLASVAVENPRISSESTIR